jgi:hypothetical protein
MAAMLTTTFGMKHFDVHFHHGIRTFNCNSRQGKHEGMFGHGCCSSVFRVPLDYVGSEGCYFPSAIRVKKFKARPCEAAAVWLFSSRGIDKK